MTPLPVAEDLSGGPSVKLDTQHLAHILKHKAWCPLQRKFSHDSGDSITCTSASDSLGLHCPCPSAAVRVLSFPQACAISIYKSTVWPVFLCPMCAWDDSAWLEPLIRNQMLSYSALLWATLSSCVPDSTVPIQPCDYQALLTAFSPQLSLHKRLHLRDST